MYRVLHVDLDQFIAAVEMLRRPELAGRPVVVGGQGDPTRRGVVATASYAAREFGVRSGMPLRTALKRCPDAVFLPSDKPAYEEASGRVMDVLRGLDAVVEVMGWDEAFLGVEADDPVAFAQDVRRAVLEATGLHSCVGIGDNLLRAKTATEFAKPPDGSGVFTLTAQNWDAVMAHRPTRALWGVGPKTAAKLTGRGIHTVADLAATDPAALAADLGPTMGPYYVQLGRGIGRTVVEGTPWVRRSLSHETTFPADLTDWDDVRAEVVTLARQVAADLLKEERDVARVAVKVRFAPFTTRTRSATLEAPTTDAAALEAAALRVLGLFTPGRAVRLLGVRAEFTPQS
ncbi:MULTISPECIES: DNA polymerase IV [unclassified Pseudonocardia]|uniref:DNA polymerase IV n=1 Tax=unclassified Pseudonocardia TaxID=2619320 RepID=UPI000AD2C616|nr:MULTISPECIES: DNA polymerase IV [unclassified Pseudonocardia]MBN9098525.1 DNA polymerase IV [Pseudonocardia sp.]